MSRILADMTPAERAECVGMWCETTSPRGLGILARLDDGYQDATVLHVDSGDSWLHGLAEVALRYDLPRAWTPDGDPVPGEWEYAVGHVVDYADGQKDCRPRYREDSRQSALASAEALKDDGYVAMSRYVTDWEVPHESR